MPTTLPMAPAVRMHMSLNVSNLERSIQFYRILFGTEPAKRYVDYAKFEINDPPLILSLEPNPAAPGGQLNHLGFRMPDSAALLAAQIRLEQAGIRSRREEGVECCYARQTKFWVTDPDQTLWEIYTLEEDLEHRGVGQRVEEMLPETNGHPAPPAVWEHRLGSPIPDAIPAGNGSLDEVRLRGTFNLPMEPAAQFKLVCEAQRALRPGGKLFVHVLVAERPLSKPPQLLGPAAAVQFTPVESEPVRLLEKAGFTRIEMVKFDAKPCFHSDGIGLRELQLVGYKFASDDEATTPSVLYKGPFRQITDDAGQTYLRGRRVPVPAPHAEQLRHGPLAEQFVFFPN